MEPQQQVDKSVNKPHTSAFHMPASVNQLLGLRLPNDARQPLSATSPAQRARMRSSPEISNEAMLDTSAGSRPQAEQADMLLASMHSVAVEEVEMPTLV